MKHRIGSLGLVLLTGCYGLVPVEPDAGPQADAPFAVAVGSVDFADGEIVLDDASPAPFVEVLGFPSSISDDGRWLVTCRWSSPERIAHLAVITDLRTGAETSYLVPTLYFSCPVISGDGTTLVHVTGEDRVGTLWAVDRATLAARVLTRGVIGAPAISDDARVIVYAQCTRPDPDACDARVHRLELGTLDVEVLDGPTDRYLLAFGLALSGDGSRVVHTISTERDRFAAVIHGDDGIERPLDISGVASWTGVSDDGRIVVSTRTEGGREWRPGAEHPVLDLAVASPDGVRTVGPGGVPTIPVSAVALSGDGRTAFFTAPHRDKMVAVRLELASGRTELVTDCAGMAPLLASDDGRTVGVGVFHCEDDPTLEPLDRTRVFVLE